MNTSTQNPIEPNESNNERPRWTAWQVLVGRRKQTLKWMCVALLMVNIPYSILLGVVGWLRSFLPLNFLFRTLSGLYPFVVIIVTAIVGTRLTVRKENEYLDSLPLEEAIRFHRQQARFKWNSIYGNCVAFFAYTTLSSTILLNRRLSEGVQVLLYFGLIPVFVLLAKLFNRLMVGVTRTNYELLNEMAEGLHWEEIPDKYISDDAVVEKIVRKLMKGSAYTVTDAVKLYEQDLAIKKAGKIAGIALLVTAVICAVFSSSGGGYSGASGSSPTPSPEPEPPSGPDPAEQERLRRQEEDRQRWSDKQHALDMGYSELYWSKKGYNRIEQARYWFNESKKY